jgi:hypothetical protein
VCDGLVGNTFWIIAQRARRSGYVRNIEVILASGSRCAAGGAVERHTYSTMTIPASGSGSSAEAISPAGSVYAPRSKLGRADADLDDPVGAGFYEPRSAALSVSEELTFTAG